MLSLNMKPISVLYRQQCRKFATDRFCKLLVVGGGSGGCSVAAKFAAKLKPGDVIVVEPAVVRAEFFQQTKFRLFLGTLLPTDVYFGWRWDETLERFNKTDEKCVTWQCRMDSGTCD